MRIINTSKKIVYFTEPMKIGKLFWRIVIIPSEIKGYGKYSTLYQFTFTEEASTPDGHWFNQHDYSGYNLNDSYLGLPKSLIKLFNANKEKIKEFIDL